MAVNTRRMQLDDVAVVVTIAADIMPFAWSERMFLSCFTENYSNFVLEQQGKVIGFSVAKRESDEQWLLNLGIAKQHQRKGLGRFFLKYVLSQSTQQWWLEVRASNAAAIYLYKQLGFVEVSRRKGYYPSAGEREDAVVMRLVSM